MKISTAVHSVPKGIREENGTKSEDGFAIGALDVLPFVAAVIDGHAPEKSANAKMVECVAWLSGIMLKHLSFLRRHGEQVFLALQDVAALRFPNILGGAVGIGVAVYEDHLIVAHVGDCRLYKLDSKPVTEVVPLTKDHNPDNPVESVRLHSLTRPGNPDSKFTMMRYGSGTKLFVDAGRKNCHGEAIMEFLSVSRGFLDRDFRPIIISNPDFATIPFDPTARHVFVLCCDGGVPAVEKMLEAASHEPNVSLEELLMLVRLHTDPEPDDDVTVLLIELSPDS